MVHCKAAGSSSNGPAVNKMDGSNEQRILASARGALPNSPLPVASKKNINQGKERKLSLALPQYQPIISILKTLKSRSPVSVHGKRDHRTRVTASTPIASTPMNCQPIASEARRARRANHLFTKAREFL